MNFKGILSSTGGACLLAGLFCFVLAGCGGGGSSSSSSGSGSGSSVDTLGYTLTGRIVLPDGSSGPGILVLASKVDEDGVSGKQAKVLAARPAVKTSFNRAVSTATAEAKGSYATVTDANGIYVLTGLDTGTYYIEATQGGLKARGRGTVSPLEAAVVDLALTPTGSITGYCMLSDGLTGGHSGTFVIIKGTDYIGFTGDDGGFVISQIPVGGYQVSFMHPGYESIDYSSTVTVPAADAAVLPSSVVLEALVGGTVSGTVTAQDELPIEGVMIRVMEDDYFAETDGDGTYQIDGMHPRECTIGFKHDLIDEGYIAEPVQVEEDGQLTVDAQLYDDRAPAWDGTPGVVYVTEIDAVSYGQTTPATDTITVAVEFGRANDASSPLTFTVYHNTVEDWDAESWDNNITAEYTDAETYDGIRGEQGVVLTALPAAGRFVFGVRVKDRHGNMEYNRSEYLFVAGDGGTTPEERDNLLTAVGCIGIGTKDPQGLLHVESSSGSAFVVDGDTGNVGIGTTEPQAALTVGSEGQTQPGSSTGTFAVDSTGNVISGAWQGDAIADDYIETVSGSKITGDIAAAQVVGDIPVSQIVGDIPSSQITGSITGASVEGDITGNADNVTGIVALENGGTGAATADDARGNLELGELSVLDTVAGGQDGTIDDASITGHDLAANTITDTQISTTAAIAGTKINPDFGHQNIVTMGKVGISTSDPKADLHVVGTVIMGPALGVTAEAGMMQFDGTGFKGYDGQEWKTLDSVTAITQEDLNADDLSDNVLSDLSDVADTTPADNQLLKWAAGTWTPAAETDPSVDLAKLQQLVTNDYHNLGGTDNDTTLSDEAIAAMGYIKTYTETDSSVDLAKLQALVTNDYHNLGGADADTTLSDEAIAAMGYIKTYTETDSSVDLAKLQALVTNDYHNLGGTDNDTTLSDEAIAAMGYIKTYTETDPQVGTITTGSVPRWDGTALSTGTISDDGTNIGIGTTTPGSKLDVKGEVRLSGATTGYVGLVAPASVTTDYTMTMPAADGTADQVLSTDGSGTLSWATASGGSSQWDDVTGGINYADGNVGIGTTSPAHILDVRGSGRVHMDRSIDDLYNLHLKTSADVNYRRAAIALESYGGLKVILSSIGEIGDFGIFTDDGSDTELERIRIINATGNVGIGTTAPAALLELKGSSDSAQFIVKANATQSNTKPLVKLQKSDGTDLAWLHSDNPANIFLGVDAGRVNAPSGSFDGQFNTFVGSESGYSNTSGFKNTAIGSKALGSNTSGDGNTAVGNEAMYNNNGAWNTAFGDTALEKNSTGRYNVGVGPYANRFNQTGSYNTIIGFQAGHGSGLHNKSSCVLIGYNAGYSDHGSNKLYIENSDSSSPLIYGEFDNNILAVNGKLGIGTTGPSEKLDVVGNVALRAQGELKLKDSDSSHYVSLKSPATVAADVTLTLPADDGDADQVLTTDGSGTLSWATAGGGSSQWDDVTGGINYAGGKIGIGTTAPGYDLHVVGTLSAGSTNRVGMGDQAAMGELPNSAFVAGQASNVSLSILPTQYGSSGAKTGLYYYNQSQWYSGLELANVASGYSNLLLMKSGGNVGIGSTDPGSKLDVKGEIRLSGTSTGYVGLTAPASVTTDYTLTLPAADGTADQVLSTNGSGTLSWATAGGSSNISTNDTSVATADTGSNGAITVTADGTAAMIVTSPSGISEAKVEGTHATLKLNKVAASDQAQIVFAQGGATKWQFNYYNGSLFLHDHVASPTRDVIKIYDDGDFTILPSGGNVGIGTTAPGEVLDVVGNVALRAQGELKLKDSDSSHYVALKSPATVAANVAWTLPAADGTADQVLSTNGSGTLSWATASGGGASAITDLSDAKTDASSVFLGSGSGANDDGTTNKNVAVGFEALSSITTGTGNVALGYQTLDTSTTGSNNLAIGDGILGACTTGSDNIALGRESMNGLTTGSHNVALGHLAISAGSNAQYNVGIGIYALRDTTGQHNVGIGPSAGMLNQGGIRNTYVGNAAGRNSTSGSYNVCIGSKAGYTQTGSYKLYIDGSNSDTSSPDTALIYGEFDNDILAVNGDLLLKDQTAAGNLSIFEGSGDGTNKVTIQSQAMAADYTLTLPAADGTADQVLSTNGSGTLSWATAGGASALTDLSDAKTDDSSVFLGSNSGASDDGSNANTAAGVDAMKSITTGVQNTAIGRSALNTATAGRDNSALGAYALYSNTSDKNIGLGGVRAPV